MNAANAEKDGKTEDFQPIVKLFCPWSNATWLLTELDPDDPDIAFGLCDLGLGFPEMGACACPNSPRWLAPAVSASSATGTSSPR